MKVKIKKNNYQKSVSGIRQKLESLTRLVPCKKVKAKNKKWKWKQIKVLPKKWKLDSREAKKSHQTCTVQKNEKQKTKSESENR